MTPGHATSEGTARYASRFPESQSAGFFRQANSWCVSSLGIGTYLGGPDGQTDRNYADALKVALAGGINFVDTSLNYRLQRSEVCVGAALTAAFDTGELRRDEVVICTKAGYLVPKAVPKDLLRPEDVVGGMHSMAPAFLTDQLRRSRENLGLETVDVFYIHNPETQIGHVSEEALYERFRQAFRELEENVARGLISTYGAATWQAFRARPGSGKGLSLGRLIEIATHEAGDGHHFRYIQLPFNMAMPEALRRGSESVDGREATVLELASQHGITVIASATLLQSKLARDLPEGVAGVLGGETDAQRAIQFTRSAPGISVALVGMSKPGHVRENLGIAQVPPMPADGFQENFGVLYQQGS